VLTLAAWEVEANQESGKATVVNNRKVTRSSIAMPGNTMHDTESYTGRVLKAEEGLWKECQSDILQTRRGYYENHSIS
jgi:hypothetical protein